MWFFHNICFILCLPLLGSSQSVTLTQPPVVVASPGSSVTLDCVVSGYNINDHHMQWVREGKVKSLVYIASFRTGFTTYIANEFKGRVTPSTSGSTAKLKINSLTAEDTSTYYCARGGLDYWGPGTLVTVTSATPTAPSVFPLSPCCEDTSSLSKVAMGCLISGYFPEPATVQWNSGAVTSGIHNFPAVLQSSSGHYFFSSQLTVPASSWQSESFQCNVAHAATSSAIAKEIAPCSRHGPVAPNVQLLHSSCSPKTDDFTIQLVCLISGFYPGTVTVNWLVDDKPGVLAAHTESPEKDATGNTFSTTSTANITQVAWKEGKKYTCQVIHQGTTVNEHASKCPGVSSDCATDGIKVSIIPPTPTDLYMNGDPKLICLVTHLESDMGLKVSWSWEKPGALNPEPLEISSESDGTFTAKSALIISKQNWLAGDIYTCKAEHPSFAAPLSMPIAKKTGKRTRPHVYLFRPHNEELRSRDPDLSITCLVKGFNPNEISIKWLENHNAVAEDNHVTTPVQMDSSQDSFFVYSKLTVSKANWNDGNSYTCHVVHEGLDMKYTQRTIEKVQGKK